MARTTIAGIRMTAELWQHVEDQRWARILEALEIDDWTTGLNPHRPMHRELLAFLLAQPPLANYESLSARICAWLDQREAAAKQSPSLADPHGHYVPPLLCR